MFKITRMEKLHTLTLPSWPRRQPGIADRLALCLIFATVVGVVYGIFVHGLFFVYYLMIREWQIGSSRVWNNMRIFPDQSFHCCFLNFIGVTLVRITHQRIRDSARIRHFNVQYAEVFGGFQCTSLVNFFCCTGQYVTPCL